jgi:hypothetical protein
MARIIAYVPGDHPAGDAPVDLSWLQKGAEVAHPYLGKGRITRIMTDENNEMRVKVRFKRTEKIFLARIAVKNGLLQNKSKMD